MVLRIGRGRGFGHSNRKTQGNGVINIVAPLIAGTLADGSTITCTPGTWFGGIPTRQWYRDGVAISGATGLTYTYVAATDDGCYFTVVETVGTITATSNALIAGQAVRAYTANLAVADGTDLQGYESWGGSATGRIKVLGGVLNQYAAMDNSMAFSRAVASNDHAFGFVYRYPAGVTANSASETRSFGVRWTNSSNHIRLVVTSGGWTLWKRVSGTDTSLASVGVAIPQGTNFVVSVSGNYVKVFINGTEASATATANGGLGISVSDVPLAARIGLAGGNFAGGGVPPTPFASGLWVDNIPANSLTITSVAVEDVPSAFGQQRIRVKGSALGTITQLQALVLSPTGKVLMPWANVSGLSGNSYDAVTTALPQEAEGGNVTVWLRDATTKGAAVSGAVAVPVAPQVMNLTVGLNSSGPDYFSDNLMSIARLYVLKNGAYREPFGPLSTDVMDGSANISYVPGSDLGIDSNGFPTKFPNAVPGYNASPTTDYPFLSLPLATWVPPVLVGTHNVTFTPGLRWDVAGLGTVMTRTAYDEAAGTATLVVTGNTAGNSNPVIIFRGYNNGSGYVAGTMPPAGVGYFRTVKQGTEGKQLANAVKSSIGGLVSKNANRGYVRWMNDLQINRGATAGLTYGERTKRRTPSFMFGMPGVEWTTYEQMLETAIETQTNVWLNIPDNATPEFIAEAAAFWRDNLPAGYKLALELSNELWNYGPGFSQYNTLAFSVPNYTAGNVAITDGEYVKGATSGLIRRVGRQVVTSGTIAAGTAAGYLLLRGGFSSGQFTAGEALHKCDAAGNVTVSNVATFDATDSGQMVRYVRQCEYMLDLFEATFGANDPRLEPVLAWQAIDSTFANITAMLNERNIYQRVKKFAIAPYVGGGIRGELGKYTEVSYFTKAQRDVIDPAGANDKAMFKTYAFNALAAMSTATEVVWRQFATDLARYCYSKGLSRTAIRPACYEYFWHHILETGTPAGQKTATLEAYAEMLRDARAGTQQNAQNAWLKNTGGDVVAFAHVNYAGTQLRYNGSWSFCDRIGMESQEPYASTTAWIAANT